MSFYAIGITGSGKNARLAANRYGVSVYGIEALGNPDSNGNARIVGARAKLGCAKKLSRWYADSGDLIGRIDAATPPEAVAYHDGLNPERRLALEEKLMDAGAIPPGLLIFYQPVIDTPVRTFTWIAMKKVGWLALGLVGLLIFLL
jgi:hypothetical protein